MRSDKSFDTYDRKVTDILTLLGDVGGLNSFIFSVGVIVVGYLTRQMFFSSIVKKIYHSRKYENMEGKVKMAKNTTNNTNKTIDDGYQS